MGAFLGDCSGKSRVVVFLGLGDGGMGYSLAWLAVRGKPPEAVREELGFTLTGEREEFPESPLSGAQIPGGWYLIVTQRSGYVALDSTLEKLSSGCELVTCFLEEHVMCSFAAGWKDGRENWSLAHESAKGRGNLVVKGEPPPEFYSIRDQLVLKQKESDLEEAASKSRYGPADHIFDIPVQTATSLTGYRYDQSIPGLVDGFEVLEGEIPEPHGAVVLITTTPKATWWGKLWGRKP